MNTANTSSLEMVRTFSAWPVTSAPRAFRRTNSTPTSTVTASTAPCSLTRLKVRSARPGAYLTKNSQKYPAKPSA